MAVRVAPEPLVPEPTSCSPATVVARVSALERRLDDAVQSLPKHAEIEVIVGRSAEAAVDKILAAVRPLLQVSQARPRGRRLKPSDDALDRPNRPDRVHRCCMTTGGDSVLVQWSSSEFNPR